MDASAANAFARQGKMKKKKESKTTFFVVIIKSESGDEYGPFLFNYNPLDDLEDFCRARWPEEFPEDPEDEWPGDWNSCLYTEVHELALMTKEQVAKVIR